MKIEELKNINLDERTFRDIIGVTKDNWEEAHDAHREENGTERRFFVFGHFNHWKEGEEITREDIHGITVRCELPTKQATEELLALFPKSYGLRALNYGREDIGTVELQINFAPNKTTGGFNETGLAKLIKTLKKADALGLPVTICKLFARNGLTPEQIVKFIEG